MFYRTEEKTIKNSKHNEEKIKNAILIEENPENKQMHLSLDILNLIKDKNLRILLIDLKIGEENLHTIFNRKKALNQIYNKIEKVNQITNNGNKEFNKEKVKINTKNRNIEKNFFIKINKNLTILTGLKYFFKNKNNEEEKIKKIIKLIQKNSKKYNYLIIEISQKNNENLNKKIIEKIDKNIIIFSNKFNEIKNTKEKIEKYKKINNNIIIYLYIKKENKKKYKEEINIKIIQEIFKEIKIIKKINSQFKRKILKIKKYNK